MPLKKSAGNMYDWVTHTHSHLAGKCSHECKYCYVQTGRFGPGVRYSGEPRLIEKELREVYGEGNIIFIEHMNDLFAEGSKDEWIDRILAHCCMYPCNEYVFQTKNPRRAHEWNDNGKFPPKWILGTTIETNRHYPEVMGKAPAPEERKKGIDLMARCEVRTFITIEPLMDFDPPILIKWLREACPSWVNIGADSKGCGLPEPSAEKIDQLIKGLAENNITIKKKTNLGRLWPATKEVNKYAV